MITTLRVLPVLVGVALLAGCGDDEPTVAPSTVTVTASPGATAAPTGPTDGGTVAGTASSTVPPASTEPSAEPSGDPAALPKQDRGHDVGYLGEATVTPDGTVLSFDRLTVDGVDDAVLASEGTPVRVDDGEAFSNQTERFYEVGVSPEARFFVTTCTAGESGPTIASDRVDLDAFLGDPAVDGAAVTFVYEDGLLVRAETNPRC